MNDDQVARSVAALEAALTMEDPAFVRRLRQVERRDAAHAMLVVALLALGAVLLAVGVGTASVVAWAVGLATLASSVIVDAIYRRRLCRTR
jgi:protein-S-isoprenylcysteine O-methyltransferase Ste14